MQNEGDFREIFLPAFLKYGLKSLDPFRDELAQKVVGMLKAGLPEDFSADDAVSEAEAQVFPILADRVYLEHLRDRAQDRSSRLLLEKRIEVLANAK